MNLKQGLKSVLHTLELAAVAVEKELPVEVCKIAMVVNATLKSVQTEFCATSEPIPPLPPLPPIPPSPIIPIPPLPPTVHPLVGILSAHIGTDKILPKLAEHVAITLEDGESGFCQGIDITIAVLNAFEASVFCK